MQKRRSRTRRARPHARSLIGGPIAGAETPRGRRSVATKMNQPAKIVVISAASCIADSFWTRARMRARLKWVPARRARQSVTEPLTKPPAGAQCRKTSIASGNRREHASAPGRVVAFSFSSSPVDTHAAAAPPPPKKITVGSLTLKYCNSDYDGYCGSIKRPLDPTGVVAGNDQRRLRSTTRASTRATPSLGTLLPQEGGPGYSTRRHADAYLNIYGSLRDHRDVLIIDKRGTGLSGAVDCPEIQTGDPSDPASLADCGAQLGTKAPLYGTILPSTISSQ